MQRLTFSYSHSAALFNKLYGGDPEDTIALEPGRDKGFMNHETLALI